MPQIGLASTQADSMLRALAANLHCLLQRMIERNTGRKADLNQGRPEISRYSRQRVAAYWRAEAERYESDAKQHEELAASYKSLLANRSAVAQARALAASHEQLAGITEK